MENITPFSAMVGGLLIGFSATLMLGFIGRIAGISGILFGALDHDGHRSNAWRWWFLIGLLVGAGLYTLAVPVGLVIRTDFPQYLLVLAGLLVGFGTRMGSGCTSGHGVCGIARLSKRSILATLIFVSVAMFTTYILRHKFGII